MITFLSDVADWLSAVPSVRDQRRGYAGSNADGPPPTGLGTEGAARRSTAPRGPSSTTVRLTADKTQNRPANPVQGALAAAGTMWTRRSGS